jgi:hypothetical protein
LLRSLCLAIVLGAILSGCLLGDNKCSANQVELAGETHGCICAEDAVPGPSGVGCVKCGDHEHVVAQKCECEMGYGRPSPDMPCEEVTVSELGDACSADMPCSGGYPYCASFEGESFCTTQGCTTNSTCEVGWMCDTSDASGFCRKPTGLGKTCMSSSECAGTEATYCETFVTKTCIIEKCVSNPAMCPSGNVCCDLTALAGTSVCTPNSVLMNGMCPDGKAPVSP